MKSKKQLEDLEKAKAHQELSQNQGQTEQPVPQPAPLDQLQQQLDYWRKPCASRGQKRRPACRMLSARRRQGWETPRLWPNAAGGVFSDRSGPKPGLTGFRRPVPPAPGPAGARLAKTGTVRFAAGCPQFAAGSVGAGPGHSCVNGQSDLLPAHPPGLSQPPASYQLGVHRGYPDTLSCPQCRAVFFLTEIQNMIFFSYKRIFA